MVAKYARYLSITETLRSYYYQYLMIVGPEEKNSRLGSIVNLLLVLPYGAFWIWKRAKTFL